MRVSVLRPATEALGPGRRVQQPEAADPLSGSERPGAPGIDEISGLTGVAKAYPPAIGRIDRDAVGDAVE